MVAGRQPVPLPYPFIRGFSKEQQEHLYLDFQAVGSRGDGTRWRTIVVAASNSSAEGRSTADYVCTGTADQGVIQRALDSMTGRAISAHLGRIVFLEGTYNLTAQVTVNNLTARSIFMEGMGAGAGVDNLGDTIVGTKFLLSSSSDYAFFFGGNSAAAGSTIVMENMQVSGTSSSPLIGARDMPLVVRQCTVIQGGTGGGISQTNSTGNSGMTRIENNIVNLLDAGTAIELAGSPQAQSSGRVTGNYVSITGAGSKGIVVDNNSGNIPTYHVSDNHVRSSSATNTFGISYLGSSTQHGTCQDNVVIGPVGIGIGLSGFGMSCVGNYVHGATIGIDTNAFQCDDTLIGENKILNAITIGIRVGTSGVTASARCSILANSITGVTTTGILLGTGANACAVLGNHIGSTVGTAFTDAGTSTVIDARGLPTGGTVGQYLRKASSTDYDAGWATLPDDVLSRIAAKGDLLVGTAAGAATNMQLLPIEVTGDAYEGRILMTDASTATGLKWGPNVTVGNTAPTSPRAGDIWIDTT